MEALSFILAVHRDDLKALATMLSQGFDPNVRDNNGNIALVAAASRKNYAAVELLLRHGADPNQKYTGNSALSHATKDHNIDMFRLILSQDKLSVEIVEDALALAASRGYSDFITALLKTGIHPDGVRLDGKALAHAAVNGEVETVELLIANGSNPNALDWEGDSVLMRLASRAYYFSSHNSVDGVKSLLTSGADPFLANSKGFSSLTKAADNQQENIIRAISSCNLPLSTPDKNGITALEIAIDAAHDKIVALLVQLGVSPDSKGKDGQPPLVRVITGPCYQKKSLLDLLIKVGADPKNKDAEGYTAYERAIQIGQKNLVKTLQGFEPNLFQEPIPISSKKPIVTTKPQSKQQNEIANNHWC